MNTKLVLCALFAVVAYDHRDTPTAVTATAKVLGPAHAASPTVVTSTCTPGGIVAAALRNDGAGWYAISDPTHSPLNIASVETGNHAITVSFAATARRIHTFTVVPDETLARAGITAGASVGTSHAEIRLARSGIVGPHAVSPHAVSTSRYPWSNLWVHGVLDLPC